jgi:D-beta-D-heptose 7-phosphate kinase/D-beta-D-heptose 1-phosphate adenosyltransferase
MIYVTGDMIIDEYIYGTTTRISPEAPVPIVDLTSRERRWGGCGNVYNNICQIYSAARLGCYYDSNNSYMFESSPKHYFVKTNKIPLKTRVISNNRYMSRLDDEEYIKDTKLEDSILEEWNIQKTGVLVLSDYNKGSIKDPQKLIKNCKGKVLVDPKLSLDNYKGAYLLKPNRKEFEDYVGKCNTPKELMAKAQLTRDHLELEYLVITLSEEGVLLVGDSIEHYESRVEEVFDVTGAGDTFMAGLALGIEAGMSISASTRTANKLAGIAVSHNGTYTITGEDWIESIKELQ